MTVLSRRHMVLAGAAIAVILLGGAVWAWLHPFQTAYILETRRFLLAIKTSGQAPEVGWATVLRRMGPRWMQSTAPAFARPVSRGAAPCPVLWRTPLGDFWGSEADGRVLDHLVMEELGGHIYDRGAAAIRRGDVVMDVGAHLGTFTRYALRQGASRVIAVEPMPSLVACLERTFAADLSAGRLAIAPVAAWSADTELEFHVGDQSTTGTVGDAGTGSLRVKAERLDAIAARLAPGGVDFIKMDIEGAEREALAGASHLLASRYPRMAICIYHTPDDARVVPETVLAAAPRYRMFTRGPFQAYFHP